MWGTTQRALPVITGIGVVVQMEGKRTPTDENLFTAIAAFLDDLTAAHRSVHTRRAYATTLYQLAAQHPGPVQQLTPEVLQRFFATHTHLQPATRAPTSCRE